MPEGFNWCQTLGKTPGARRSGGLLAGGCAGSDAALSLPWRRRCEAPASGWWGRCWTTGQHPQLAEDQAVFGLKVPKSTPFGVSRKLLLLFHCRKR